MDESVLTEEDTHMLKKVRGIKKTMEDRCKLYEQRAKHHEERTAEAKQRILNARAKISHMHKNRAFKEEIIERIEFKTKAVEDRLKTIEQKIDLTRKGMRIDIGASDVLVAQQKKLKEAFQHQSERHTLILRTMMKKDQLEKQINAVQDKNSRARERMEALINKLKSQVDRQAQVKTNIRYKVTNIKKVGGEIVELEPRLRDAFTHMYRMESLVYQLQDKLKRKEEDIRRVRKEAMFAAEEKVKASVEYNAKKERKYKGALRSLTTE